MQLYHGKKLEGCNSKLLKNDVITLDNFLLQAWKEQSRSLQIIFRHHPSGISRGMGGRGKLYKGYGYFVKQQQSGFLVKLIILPSWIKINSYHTCMAVSHKDW